MKIIVFSGKYGDDIYDASTDEALARACASRIKDYFEMGWYYPPSGPYVSQEDRELSEISDAVADSLPQSMRQKRKIAIANILSGERRYKSELDEYEAIKKIAECATLHEAAALKLEWETRTGEKKSRPLAYHVVMMRNGGEYEGYDIKNLDEPTW